MGKPLIEYQNKYNFLKMKKVRAKFVCTCVEDQPTYEQKVVSFSPVISGSEENKSFAKYTPSGNLQLSISYQTPASEVFEQGKEYYLDINLAHCEGEVHLVTFGAALEALKKGKRVARNGWNGKGMFIFMRPADELNIAFVVDKVKSLPESVKRYFEQDVLDEFGQRIEVIEESDTVKFTAYLCMKAADGTIVNGWLASQTDMLSEDWVILD